MSPNFPQPYPSYIETLYEILAPSSSTITLQFLEFRVYAYYYACNDYYNDYLEVCVMFAE